MPLYEYRCRECAHQFEVLQRMGEKGSKLRCPQCDAAKPERQLSTFAASSGNGAEAACATPGCAAPSGFT